MKDRILRAVRPQGPADESVRLVGVVIAVTIVFAVVDAAWLPFSSVEFDPRNLAELGKSAIGVALALSIALLAGHRARAEADVRPIARVVARIAKTLRRLAIGVGLIVPLGFSGALFMYVASATQRPLVDRSLAEIDHYLGFDWLSFLHLANSSPVVATTLTVAYQLLALQTVVLLLVLSSHDDFFRLAEFLAALALASLMTGLVMALFPSAGAYAYFEPARAMFSNFAPDAGMWHYSDLMKLRSGRPFDFLIGRSEGLVTFPSFHTCLGILIVYAVRRHSTTVVAVLAANLAMIVATLPEGGHHLVDVLAGAAIAAAAILSVRAVAPSTAASELPVAAGQL